MKIGRYEVVRELGAGGMGRVYQARDPALDRDVAVKLMVGDSLDPQMQARFFREAMAAAKAVAGKLGPKNIANVITIYDIADHQGMPFIVMEYLQGRDLGRLLESLSPLPLTMALDIALQTARGLAAAHENGVIHRDIKPTNIWVMENSQVKILDFGIAMLPMLPRLTNAGQAVGTPAYMAPEQVAPLFGRRRAQEGPPADHRADLWSLAVVLFEMLEGSLPFDGSTPLEMMANIMSEAPNPLTKAVPDRVRTLLSRALSRDPNDRYQSVEQFGVELGIALNDALARPSQDVTGVPPAAAAGDLQTAIRRTRPSICQVEVDGGTATGFFVGEPTHVITCHHVVHGRSKARIQLMDGSLVRALVVGHDPHLDLALLRLEEGEPRPSLLLANAEEIQEGQKVMVIGFPLGGFSVSQGIVSCRSRIARDVSYLQTDAAMNPGNSGGPIIDQTGRVLGVVAWGVRGLAEGIGFGIATPHVRSFLAKFRIRATGGVSPGA